MPSRKTPSPPLELTAPPPPPIDSLGQQSTYLRTVLAPSLVKSAFAAINAPVLLVASLWLMAAQWAYYLYALHKQQAPLVSMLPFVLSVAGASVGAVWECEGVPLVLSKLVQSLRAANVPAVTAAISMVTLAQAFPAASDVAVLAVYAMLLLYTTALSLLAMCTGPTQLLIVQIQVEILLAAVAALWSPLGSVLPFRFIALRAGSQVLGFLDPSGGTIFHILNIAAGYYLFEGLHAVPVSAGSQWVVQITAAQLVLHSLAAVTVVVLLLKLLKPVTYSVLRFLINDVLWQSIYAGLLSLPAWYPQPMREQIYANNMRVDFVAYGSTHPRASLYEFKAAKFISLSQRLFNYVVVKLIFVGIQFCDTFFPQARAHVPLSQKHRVTGTYTNYFPPQMAAIVGPASQQRATVLEWRAKGQMLSYVVNYGHASTMLSRGDQPDEVILDLNFMSDFESKPDFVKYGGVARFRVRQNAVDSVTNTSQGFAPLLELVSISPTKSSRVLPVPSASDPALTNPCSDFRKAERVLLASAMANCVIAKHCAGIHSYFNLIAVSLHNAFDTQPWLRGAGDASYPHPIRLALMPHFYNHVIVEEITTPHLLERYAVFPQIFNFTDVGLSKYYDRQFSLFELNSDADLNTRFSILGLDESASAKLDPVCATLSWEVEYHRIFLAYTTALVEATYHDADCASLDDAVKNDPLIVLLEKELRTALPKGLPARYGRLNTVATLARFMADTIFCVCIRHQIYGVNTSHYGDDWQSCPNQVPADYGVPAVEDYMSQLYVALATTRPPYILFKPRDVAHRWNYLLSPLVEAAPLVYTRFSAAFNALQAEFDLLEAKYTSDAVEKLVNFELNRALPSDLCPGSAY